MSAQALPSFVIGLRRRRELRHMRAVGRISASLAISINQPRQDRWDVQHGGLEEEGRQSPILRTRRGACVRVPLQLGQLFVAVQS